MIKMWRNQEVEKFMSKVQIKTIQIYLKDPTNQGPKDLFYQRQLKGIYRDHNMDQDKDMYLLEMDPKDQITFVQEIPNLVNHKPYQKDLFKDQKDHISQDNHKFPGINISFPYLTFIKTF